MEEKIMENIGRGKVPDDFHELFYQELINNPFVGINLVDGNGTVLFVNETHGRITGQSYKLYVGHSVNQLVEDKIISNSATISVLKTGKSVRLNQVVTSGKTFQVEALPIKDKLGNIKYVLNYLIDVSELMETKEKMAEFEADKNKLQDDYQMLKQTLDDNNNLIYQSKIMQRIVEQAKKVAESDVTILIIGPSGSGKEHIANIIHESSKRNNKPFIKINCAAIPEQLLESELFGYEPGAFTGGNPKGKKGLFESANQGSLLLDEIGELPLTLQSKLLRVLQDHEVRRIGGNKTIHVDFRLIASTNAVLKEMIAAKKFREDLYYRINVIEMSIPGLEDRREDIPLLIEHFIRMFNAKYETNKTIQTDAIKYLTSSEYPGNVRQLRNIVERLIVQSPDNKITIQDVYESLGVLKIKVKRQDIIINLDMLTDVSLKDMVSEYEKILISEYLKIYGNATLVAKKLKMNQSTISRKITKYKICD